MTARALVLAVLCLLGSGPVETPGALEQEMNRLGVRSALVLASQSVDEQPYWSPAGDALAINVAGDWKLLDFAAPRLTEGTWHGKETLGVLAGSAPKHLTDSTARAWSKSGKTGTLKLVTRAGTRVEIEPADLGSRFVIARTGQSPATLWTTSLESCHGLSLSPDQRLVAFVCELNGVIVTRL